MARRLHLSVAMGDPDREMGFYTALFGVEPSVRKDYYAKWMIDDPRLSFTISSRVRSRTRGFGLAASRSSTTPMFTPTASPTRPG